MDRLQFRTNFWIEERQAFHIDLVSCRRNNMFGQNFARGTVDPAQMQPDFTVLDLGAFDRLSQDQRHPPHHLVFYEPTAGRTEGLSDDIDAQTLWQIMKERGSIGKETRAHSRAEPRIRMAHSLPPGPALTGLRSCVEFQRSGTSDELDIRIRV